MLSVRPSLHSFFTCAMTCERGVVASLRCKSENQAVAVVLSQRRGNLTHVVCYQLCACIYLYVYADYEPGAKDADDQLWDPEWDDEGNDGEFKKIIKEELAAAKK
jgi:hypothetical protein